MPESRPVRGCCPHDCQDTCSWIAHVEDGRVTRMEGAKDHPFTRGALCAKVNDYQVRTYAPDRLLQPLRRTGPKGSGSFERIEWDEAIDTIAARFGEIVSTHGAEALLPLNYLGSLGVLQRRALMRLFHTLGASRFHGSICGAPGNVIAAEGHPRGFDPEEIADSRFVLLWGANVLTTSHHHFHFLKEARRRHGARIVTIDPRRTITARASDEHVSILPGSDSVLAAGLAREMFERELVDLDHARAVAADLDDFRAQVDPWTPERVAEVCGVAPDTVRRLAHELGTARPATIRGGVGPQQTLHGEALVRSLSALAILGGHWKHRGGGLFIEANPVFDESPAARPDLGPQGVRSLDMARLGEHLTSRELDPPILGLMVWTMNPAIDQPDLARVREGLAREDLFTVVLEHFMTDTARYADIVLPSTTQLEHMDVQGAWGHHYVSANNPAIAPVGESKSHPEVLRLLASRMGLTEPALFQSDEEIVSACLWQGTSLAELRDAGWAKRSRPRPDLEAEGPGLVLSGPVPLPPTPPYGHALRLLTPKAHHFLNSTFANLPRQRTAMERPTLEMHERDAGARGLTGGQEVRVRNGRGEVRAWITLTDGIHPGVVSLPGKWWRFPEATGAVANELTPAAWSVGGQPAYNDTFVEVVSAAE
ncbi:MAG TPA: molybdopterin-dependent oxidoreductase [Longimicrobiales bacterium]|nr:molybdopterin-dependent oxidoreductase [Longimicrobiales bacterium]